MKKILFLLFFLIFALIILSFFVKTNPNSYKQTEKTSNKTDIKTQVACSGVPTPPQTEGPYYKMNSPKRNDIANNIPGQKLVITGLVLNKSCKPIVNAWLDFWQADSNGEYDNIGFNLRGYQFTDENGMFRLETIMPAQYGTRPPHIHVKIKSEKGTSITSQLYFPDSSQNKSDPIFNEKLVIKDGKFNFILDE